MSQNDSLKSPTLHATIGLTGFVFVVMIAMASIFEVEVVATGRGKVVPLSRVQVIQPEFGGVLQSIAVRNGQSVKQGDVVIAFDSHDAASDVQQLQGEEAQLRIEAARIEALVKTLEASGGSDFEAKLRAASVAYPEALAKLPFALEQRKLFQIEVAAIMSLLQEHVAQLENAERAIDLAGADLERATAGIGTAKERHDSAKILYEGGTANRRSYLDALDVYTALMKDEEKAERAIAEKQSILPALNASFAAQIANRANTLQERLSDIDRRRGVLIFELALAQRRLDASILRAPRSGTVDQLKVFTLGGVVEGGQELLHIVPDDGKIEVEAIFGNADIGFLSEGQVTRLRFDAYPSARFGSIEGIVLDVSADAKELSPGQFGYTLRIQPKSKAFEISDEIYSLSPGLTMDVDVVTRKRTIISYFLLPILETVDQSLREQ